MTAGISLECLSRQPVRPSGAPPLLFVHGAYSSAWVWDVDWMPQLAASGRAVHALSLEGHGQSDGHLWLAACGIDDYVGNVRQIVATLPEPPVLVGHSMGGFVVQRYLELGHEAAGVVLLASVPPRGLTRSTLNLLRQAPDLLGALQLFQASESYHPQAEKVKKLLFSNDMSLEQIMQWGSRFQPESMRAIFDLLLVGLFTPSALSGLPALVLGGAEDRIISPTDVQETAERFGVEGLILPDLGHMMMLDAHNAGVLLRIQDWLQQHWPI
ncbi:alpha/beta hydrolase [Laribacter hongkongensis]|uniref:alpha/beta hydrolase n=1 Tax=Laribacter hongkongensis TaxID=168471 RepID=UPI001EFD948C|nr:alpha/beta hydrolase [Laribacter hongkongensis]MCG9051655.1 alpha/beta hydrolase [Laribacter hongkongensis]